MRRGTLLCTAVLAVIAALTMALPATAQAGDAVLLRAKYAPDEVWVTASEARQAGTLTGGIPQVIEQDTTVLTRTRSVMGDEAVQDGYVLTMRLLVTLGGEVQVDTDRGLDLHLGALDPRGKCITTRSNVLGHTLETIGGPGENEPIAQVSQKLQEHGTDLPEEPVSPGDTWKRERQVELAGGTASMTINWQFVELREVDGRRYAILAGDAVATLRDFRVPRKSMTVDTPNGRLDLLIDEYVETLRATEDTELVWDIEAGRPVSSKSNGTLEATSSQTVMSADGTVLQSVPSIGVTRQGTTTTTYRKPTDHELAHMAALALTNSISRKDSALLRTVLADGYDAAGFEGDLAALATQYEKLEASLSGFASSFDGDSGKATFTMTVLGAVAAPRPGPDVGPLEKIHETPVTLSLSRAGELWRVTAIETR